MSKASKILFLLLFLLAFSGVELFTGSTVPTKTGGGEKTENR